MPKVPAPIDRLLQQHDLAIVLPYLVFASIFWPTALGQGAGPDGTYSVSGGQIGLGIAVFNALCLYGWIHLYRRHPRVAVVVLVIYVIFRIWLHEEIKKQNERPFGVPDNW